MFQNGQTHFKNYSKCCKIFKAYLTIIHYKVNKYQTLCGNFSFFLELLLSVLLFKNDFVIAIIKKVL